MFRPFGAAGLISQEALGQQGEEAILKNYPYRYVMKL
jgi:hypothetical protein